MSQHIELTGEFQDHQFGQRLDQALAELFPDYSRTRIKEWILQDRVTLDGQVANTPREKVLAGQKVHGMSSWRMIPVGMPRTSSSTSSMKMNTFW